jgi:hypothetical protein
MANPDDLDGTVAPSAPAAQPPPLSRRSAKLFLSQIPVQEKVLMERVPSFSPKNFLKVPQPAKVSPSIHQRQSHFERKYYEEWSSSAALFGFPLRAGKRSFTAESDSTGSEPKKPTPLALESNFLVVSETALPADQAGIAAAAFPGYSPDLLSFITETVFIETVTSKASDE